jgi:hypothetical protein
MLYEGCQVLYCTKKTSVAPQGHLFWPMEDSGRHVPAEVGTILLVILLPEEKAAFRSVLPFLKGATWPQTAKDHWVVAQPWSASRFRC